MTDTNKTINDAFVQAGIDVQTAEYSITEYSLNTSLSFKFENVDDFLLFLGLSTESDGARVEKIHSTILEAGIDPANFFYVNFYKPKVAEL